MKKELLEIKRTLTIDRYNITRITGYIVDNDRNCRLEFVKNFLNLEETENKKAAFSHDCKNRVRRQ